jgi:hypothetical protein
MAAAQALEDKEQVRTTTRATATKTKALDDALLQAKTVEEIDAAYLKFGDGAQRRDVLKAARTSEKETSAIKNFSVFYSKKYPEATPEEINAIASDPELRKAVADPTKSMFEHIKTKNGYVIYDKKTGKPVNGGSVKGGFSSSGSGGGAGAGTGQATGAAIGVGPAGEQVYRTKGGALFVYGSDGSTVAYQGEVLPKGSTPKVTEDQAKAAAWTAQIDNAANVIYEVIEKDPAVLEMSLPEYLRGKIPVVGEDVANVYRSPDRQRFVNAAQAAAEAALRAATGAGVNNQEQRQKIAELTPQLGDSVEVIKDKLNSLKMYAEALRQRAGPAIKPKVEGEPAPKVGAIIDGHRYIGGDPASALAWKKLAAPKGGAR